MRPPSWRSLAVLALAATWLAVGSPALANPMLERGIRHLTELESGKAIKQLRRALRWPGNTPAELATIHLYLGIAHFNLQRPKEAAASFRSALKLKPEIQLPRLTSPRIEELFNSLRPETPSRPPPPRPPALPPSSNALAAPAPPASDPAALSRRPGPRGSWPAWTVAGVGAAAGIAAVVLGSLTVVENNQAADLGLSSREAIEHHDAAASRALGANVCFAVAGAAAVTSGVLFYLGWRKAKRAAREERAPPTIAAERFGVLRW